jgi:hypothetical protein
VPSEECAKSQIKNGVEKKNKRNETQTQGEEGNAWDHNIQPARKFLERKKKKEQRGKGKGVKINFNFEDVARTF